MRKINKKLELATAYKKWLDAINKSGKNHPKYNSSNFRFYYDIIANLLWVQDGLCAYTEMYLINKNHVASNKFTIGKIQRFDFLGQLDHYDSLLKDTKGWEWTNFFMIHSDVNRKKNDKPVNSILKPDKDDYDPFYFLEYDFRTYNFIPNKERDFDLQLKILQDINFLGLNFQPIIDYRRDELNPIIDKVDLGTMTVAEARRGLKKFYTAFEMSLKHIEKV